MTYYKTYLGILVLSALGSFWLTPLASWLAYKVGAVDIPNARKVHVHPMPRLGGVAVFFGFLLPFLALTFRDNPVTQEFRHYDRWIGLVLGAGAMLALGIYDDIKGADASKKFIAQTVIAVGLWCYGFHIESIRFPYCQALPLNAWLGLPVTVLWIVGLTNAINLLDGIDGLVAGVTACIALSLAVINIINVLPGHIVVAMLTLALAGACLGFLPHNHAPARIFLGDSGSLTIGLLLACTAIVSLFPEHPNPADPGATASSLITIPLILFALPLFDTARVMYHRWSRNVSIFQADRNHIHHRLLAMGLSHRQAAWTLYCVAAGTGLLSVVLSLLEDAWTRKFLSLMFAGLAVGFVVLWRVRLRHFIIQNEEPATAAALKYPATPPPAPQAEPAEPAAAEASRKPA